MEKDLKKQVATYTKAVNSLLSEKIYPITLEAVETKDKKLFIRAMDMADIPQGMRECLLDDVFKAFAAKASW